MKTGRAGYSLALKIRSVDCGFDSIGSKHAEPYELGEYEFFADSGELRFRGRPVSLEPKAALLLGVLIKHAGEVVPRQLLSETLWPEGSANDDRLNYTVARVRRALRHCNPSPVSTCWRAGYRLEIVPRSSDISAEPRLRGRHAELKELRRLLAGSARASTFRIATIVGRAGIGKSALIRAFAQDVIDAGYAVVLGQCVNGQDYPLWPWQMALDCVVSDAGRLCAMSSYERVEAVSSALLRLSDKGPLVLIFEDIHLADQGSIELLELVSIRLEKAPVLLVATCRAPLSKELPSPWHFFASRAAAISLGPLSRALATELIRRTQQKKAVPSFMEEKLLTLAAGNPAALITMLQDLPDDTFEFDLRGFLKPPSATASLVRSWLAPLDAAAEMVLAKASVIGLEFELRLLSLASGTPASALMGVITKAVASDVVRPHRENTYLFVQPLCREYLRANIAESELRAFNWRLGYSMLQLHYEQRPNGITGIVDHLSAGATSVALASEAAGLLRAAGDRCLHRGAVDSARIAYLAALKSSLDGAWSPKSRAELAIPMTEALRCVTGMEFAAPLVAEVFAIARASDDWSVLGKAAHLFGLPRDPLG